MTRKGIIDTLDCLCGKQEDAYHFFFVCKNSSTARYMSCLINYLPYLSYVATTIEITTTIEIIISIVVENEFQT